MIQLTKEQALKIAESGCWKNWTDEEIVKFQLYQDRLCMDFSRFQEAVEKVLGRSVWTHEFAYVDGLKEEYEGKKPKPTIADIISLLDETKTILVLEPPESLKKGE